MKKLKEKMKNRISDEKAAKLSRILRVLRTVKNIVCWTMIVLMVFLVITFLFTRIAGGTPSVFGYTLHRVESGSMQPYLQVGDVLLNKQVGNESELQVNDIITFQGDSRFENRKVTHRIVVAPFADDEGDLAVITKGDANQADDGEIKMKNVESKVIAKVEFLRWIYSFFFSPWGLIIFIALMVLIFFDEVMNIIHIMTGEYDEIENEESIGEIIDRIQREDEEKKKKKQHEIARMNDYSEDYLEFIEKKEDWEDAGSEHSEDKY